MRKVADHLQGRLTFESAYSRATNYFRPGTRSSDHPAMGPRQASSTEPRTKTTFINWIERCSHARKYRHITKFRFDRNVTHSLAAHPLLSCENRSATSPRELAGSIRKPRWKFPEPPYPLLPTRAVSENIL